MIPRENADCLNESLKDLPICQGEPVKTGNIEYIIHGLNSNWSEVQLRKITHLNFDAKETGLHFRCSVQGYLRLPSNETAESNLVVFYTNVGAVLLNGSTFGILKQEPSVYDIFSLLADSGATSSGMNVIVIPDLHLPALALLSDLTMPCIRQAIDGC